MSIEQQVLELQQQLAVLYHNNDPHAKTTANQWLSEFQKEPAAWIVGERLLNGGTDIAPESRYFAAQTLRSKILHDLDQLQPPETRIQLRDSLQNAFVTFASGPRNILTQICLSLADLAIQLPNWSDPVNGMIETYWQNPVMAPALLEFLSVLPIELTSERRISIENPELITRDLAESRAERIIGLLTLYTQASGVTIPIQNSVLLCLDGWISAGEILPAQLLPSPLFAFVFQALTSEPLFDAACDVVCRIIRETQEIHDNSQVISEIVPRIAALSSHLSSVADDPDRLRGYCRIFVEAGETYSKLFVKVQQGFPSRETLLPIASAIAQCARCDDLDIVPITFNFWYTLTEELEKHPHDPANQPLFNIYSELYDDIIRHCRFPENEGALVGQEYDDFRDFRHHIGDTLRKCSKVLTVGACLKRAYDMIASTLTNATSAIRWQDIEAPLFAIRLLGSEVDQADDGIISLILDLVPKLPQHPRIRYTALLVIGRYSIFLSRNPDRLSQLLPYVLGSFTGPQPSYSEEDDVQASAAQSLQYILQDCSQELVPSFQQLYDTFTNQIEPQLKPADLYVISDGLTSVIGAMPPETAPPAFQQFCLPVIQTIHEAAVTPAPLPSEAMKKLRIALARLDGMVKTFWGSMEDAGYELPESCTATSSEVWPVFDALIVNHGTVTEVSERACGCIRQGLRLFNGRVTPQAVSSILERMVSAFEQSGLSGYVWITSKIMARYSTQIDATSAFNRVTVKLAQLIQTQPSDHCANEIEDYCVFAEELADTAPHVLFLSPAFTQSFDIVLAALDLYHSDIILRALEVIRKIIGHDCFDQDAPPSLDNGGNFAMYRQTIASVLLSRGAQLTKSMMTGLVSNYSDDCASLVFVLTRLLAKNFGDAFVQWVPIGLDAIPRKTLTAEQRNQFAQKFMAAITSSDVQKVRASFIYLDQQARRNYHRDNAVGQP